MKSIEYLKSKIFNTDENIDQLISSVLEKSTNYDYLKNITLQTIIQNTSLKKDASIKDLFESLNKKDVQIESDRLSKYNDYEKILQKLPTIEAAINTLIDNIITPDNNFSSVFKYDVKNIASLTSDYKTIINIFKQIIESKKIENITEKIVYDLVVYGCFFVEIESTKALLKKYEVLEDSEDVSQTNKMKPIEATFSLVESSDEKLRKNNIGELLYDTELNDLLYVAKRQSASLLEDTDQEEEVSDSLDSIRVTVYSPKNVVVVYLFDVILGYLIIQPQEGTLKPGEQVAQEILKKIFSQSNIPKMREIIKENPQYENYIGSLLRSYVKNSKGISNIKTKFVPSDSMVHGYIGQDFPYGKSRLESFRELAKYLIIGNNATMLYRFTRAPDIRVFKVDIGMDHDSAKYINQVKQQLVQKKYAVNITEDVDILTKQLTQFDDLWIPTKQGQEFFQIDIQPTGDLQSKIEDLKFLNDQIISGLDTPPNYLGLERSEDSRYTLAQMNAKYAKTISRIQRVVNNGINSLVKNIFYRISTEENKVLAKSISIKLNPPVSLILERSSEMYGNVNTILETLGNLGLPKKYFLKQLLPWLDFVTIEDAQLSEDIDKIIEKSNKSSEEEGEGGGGGFF